MQGAFALAIMVTFLALNLFGAKAQQPSRIVAGGSVGTWLLVGFVGYLIVGVLAVGVSALFYHYIEVIRGNRYTGINNGLAWAHLLLLNIGAAGAAWLMMIAGYTGGSHLLISQTPPPAVYGEVHAIIEWTIWPIAVFLILGALGSLLGGIGYVRAWFGKGTG